MNLKLEERERELLALLLEAVHRDKLRELHHTATMAYRQKLRGDIEIIEGLGRRLAAAHASTAS